MKKLLLLLLLTAVVAAGLIYAYHEMSGEREHEVAGERPVSAPSRVQRSADGAPVITLGAETQKRLGLVTSTPKASALDREAKAFGRVLDTASLAAHVADLVVAQANLEVSRKEWQRVKTLFEQGQSASARAVETAEAAMKRDQVALHAAETRLVAAWGKPIAEQPDLPEFARALATRESALVRLDLPLGERLAEPPVGARLLLPDAETTPLAARFLGPATTTDPQMQGQGFLFLVKPAPSRLAPGLALTGFLQLPGEPLRGVTVPSSAVVRAAGRGWIYVQTGAETFTRRAVPLEHPVDGGWFLPSGLTATDAVVVTGAQALLSEELKAQIQLVE